MLVDIIAFFIGVLVGAFSHRWLAQEAATLPAQIEAAVHRGMNQAIAAAKVTPKQP